MPLGTIRSGSRGESLARRPTPEHVPALEAHNERTPGRLVDARDLQVGGGGAVGAPAFVFKASLQRLSGATVTSPSASSLPDQVTVNLDLSVGDYRLQGRVSIPSGPTPLRVMLPVVQSLADGLVNMATKTVEDQGKRISCTKGCGACCRQLVPITEVEARHIAALVDELPEPRRSTVRARFGEARKRLEEAGMLQRLLEREHWTEEEFRRIGLEYFHLGIACPFLEEESCSIHKDRPITCREYLVTSPAQNCASPTPENIDWVPLAVKVWRELARFDPTPPESPYLRWVPLILASDWAAQHPDELPLRPGPDWLRELFERIAEKARTSDKAASSPETLT